MNAPITFAICGFGDRGSTYAGMQELFPERMKVVAVADLNPAKVQKAKELYNIPEENCFASGEEMLAKEKLADVMVVSTMDRQHVDHAIPALEKGYHVLMEKPISPDLHKCREVLAVAARHPDQHVILCHVLRYTMFFNKLKEIIDSGKIGEVVSICANENVAYWHQAHSFVRGNWRNSHETSPMILQKSCHDMDILTWLVGKKCKSVSSVGGIHLFKEERAPAGSTPYCLGGCKVKDSCIFDAEKIYITSKKTGLAGGSNWISSILSVDNTLESTYAALKDGQYGRCVFHCDNNVVDHQQTNLLMEDGTTISFTMCAFTQDCYRYFKAMGTLGEIEADMKSNCIKVRVFGQEEEVIDLKAISKDLKGHGGGDSGIVEDFLKMLIEGAPPTQRTTTLANSMESHYIALAAEESRLAGGKAIDLEEFRNR
ncbi:MAG: Gfo/Idh/MocA family oxidoreductase [Acutalibacter sp.]|nr:Gfo/Idh/MocA family oxidoreductase [Acutalibacter sp.]